MNWRRRIARICGLRDLNNIPALARPGAGVLRRCYEGVKYFRRYGAVGPEGRGGGGIPSASGDADVYHYKLVYAYTYKVISGRAAERAEGGNTPGALTLRQKHLNLIFMDSRSSITREYGLGHAGRLGISGRWR